MNERIKELMGKTLDDKFSHTWDTMTYEGLLQFSEKFAELIVKECSDLFEIEWGEEKLTGNDVGYVLKKHFGVEE
jgi:hypothetical protein